MTKCLVDEVFRSYLRKFRHFVIKRIPRSQLHVLSSLRVQKTTDIGINHLTLWTFSKTRLEQCFARISRSAKKKNVPVDWELSRSRCPDSSAILRTRLI